MAHTHHHTHAHHAATQSGVLLVCGVWIQHTAGFRLRVDNEIVFDLTQHLVLLLQGCKPDLFGRSSSIFQKIVVQRGVLVTELA